MIRRVVSWIGGSQRHGGGEGDSERAQWTLRSRRKRATQVSQSSNPEAVASSIVRYAGSRLAPQNALGDGLTFRGTTPAVRLRGDFVSRR